MKGKDQLVPNAVCNFGAEHIVFSGAAAGQKPFETNENESK